MNTLNFKSSGLLGDIAFSLPYIKKACENHNAKANIYIWLNKAWEAYGNYHDATKKGEGLISEDAYFKLKPLLEALPFVNEVGKWKGEQIAVNFDTIKVMGGSLVQPYMQMQWLPALTWPDIHVDLSKPTIHLADLGIDIEKQLQARERFGDSIIVNRTQRKINPHIDYMFLKQYENVLFVGTLTEYDLFIQHNPKSRRYQVEDFLELLIAIGSCKLFIGNDSFCMALAEIMKIPRILEVCTNPDPPTGMPIGPNGYAFTHQHSLEYLVNILSK